VLPSFHAGAGMTVRFPGFTAEKWQQVSTHRAGEAHSACAFGWPIREISDCASSPKTHSEGAKNLPKMSFKNPA